MASLNFYEDKKCTVPMKALRFVNNSIEYMVGDGKRKMANVVKVGEVAETDVYLRNEGVTDLAVFDIRGAHPDITLEIYDTGYLRPGEVFRVHVRYKPSGREALRGNLEITAHEIFQ